jgi:hypothetical protein
MVSTFIAAIMRISASVNERQAWAVMLNISKYSDLRCPGESIQRWRGTAQLKTGTVLRARTTILQSSSFNFVCLSRNPEPCFHDEASVNLALIAHSPTSGEISDSWGANSSLLLANGDLLLREENCAFEGRLFRRREN